MTLRRLNFLIASGLIAALSTLACVEPPAGAGDSGLSNDASLTDVGPADAGIDARPPRPDATVYDFCDQPLFKLPIDGMTEVTNGIDIWGTRLAYSKYSAGDGERMEVYLFDAMECMGYQLTNGAGSGGQPSIWGNTVVWTDNRNSRQSPYYCRDLYSYDLEVWSEFQLTSDPLCEHEPKTNGRYVAFTKNTAEEMYAPADFRLRDLETDEEIVLAPAHGQVGYFDLSDRYVVWSQYRGGATSKGRDIVYYDLEAGEMGWVEQSAEHYTYAVFTSGDYLTYLASAEYDMAPWSLHLVNIVTKDSTVLSDDDDAVPFGYISGNLVTWNTAKFAEPPDQGLIDNMIYDIRSGLSRRLTTRSSKLGIGEVGFPYVLLGRWLGISPSNNSDYYLANLVELGVTDLDGNLLPGDPVLDPPPGAQ